MSDGWSGVVLNRKRRPSVLLFAPAAFLRDHSRNHFAIGQCLRAIEAMVNARGWIDTQSMIHCGCDVERRDRVFHSVRGHTVRFSDDEARIFAAAA